MDVIYKTPLARWARICEIFIPGYMFGKSWGMADEKTVDLFRAQFPAFFVDIAERIKMLVSIDSEAFKILFATTAGAIVGFAVLGVLAAVMHLVLGDRKYINSLRFTAVTLIPIAVLNGTLSHGVKTLVEKMNTQTAEALYKSAVVSPWSYFALNCIFYILGLWMFGRRTGVPRAKRKYVLAVGIAFLALYLGCGLMITPGEWSELLPKLQKSLAH
ncbi:MAG: hypothetical protein WCQ99_15715 [Pseudomonadota bacterium]